MLNGTDHAEANSVTLSRGLRYPLDKGGRQIPTELFHEQFGGQKLATYFLIVAPLALRLLVRKQTGRPEASSTDRPSVSSGVPSINRWSGVARSALALRSGSSRGFTAPSSV